jgi:hypothetical protein
VKKPRKRSPTLSQLKKRAWKLLSEVIRAEEVAREEVCRCYTCGVMDLSKYMQAGHAIPGRTGAVLLDEEIIRPQCYRCNVALRGNYQQFIYKLIRENGMEWWEKKLSESRQVKKWTRSDLLSKIQHYQRRLEALDTH